MPTRYDLIGHGYGLVRRPDPRLATLIRGALGAARTVVNIGAGTGSYEPEDVFVVSAEPSRVMLEQHPGTHRVLAVSEALPFADSSFDAAMAIMTVHHWAALDSGLAEMRRVARRQVVWTWDPDFAIGIWMYDYLPILRDIDRSRFGPMAHLVNALDAHTVIPVPIPWDFTDGLQAAFWHRPEAYLDPAVRAASSTFAAVPDAVMDPAIQRLSDDLASGAWLDRYESLLHSDAMDYGYRLIVAG